MALPFYNQGDQDIYAGGEHFIPQERFRLNYTPSTSLASTVGNTGGVTGTQAASPYIWPPQGGGGRDEIEEDTFSMGMSPGALGGKLPGIGNWAKRTFGDIKYGLSDFPTPGNLIRKGVMKWRENREIKRQEEIAQQKRDREQTIQGYSTWKSPSGRDHVKTGGIGSPESRAGGKPGTQGTTRDWAEGGRVGLYAGGDPEEPAENIFEFMQDQDIPFSDQVEAGPTEEQIAMVIDMDGQGIDMETISSITQLGKETIMNILGVEMAQGGIARLL